MGKDRQPGWYGYEPKVRIGKFGLGRKIGSQPLRDGTHITLVRDIFDGLPEEEYLRVSQGRLEHWIDNAMGTFRHAVIEPTPENLERFKDTIVYQS